MEHDYYLILFVDDVWLLDIFIFNDNVQFPEGNIPQYFININRNPKVLKVSIQDSAFSVFFFSGCFSAKSDCQAVMWPHRRNPCRSKS